MDVRINVDSRGVLSPGQRLGVEVSLMPGYDVVKQKIDSFTLCIYAIPSLHLERCKLGPSWYKEAAAEDIDFHTIDCYIKQQADADGKLQATASEPSLHEEIDANMFIGISANTNVERRKGEDTRNFQSTNPKVDSEAMAKESPPPPPMKRIDQMRLIREHAQGSHQLDYKMYRHNEELMMRVQVVQEYREYLRAAMKKCLDWIEKSRPYFGSHKTDEEYESALLMTKCTLETEHDSVSGMSGAHRLRDSSPPVSVESGTPSPKEKPHVRGFAVDYPKDMPFLDILVTLDMRVSDLGVSNSKSLRLLQV